MKQFWKKLLAVMTATAFVMLFQPMDVKASGDGELKTDGTVKTETTSGPYVDETTMESTGRHSVYASVYSREPAPIDVKALAFTLKAHGSASDSSATMDIKVFTYDTQKTDAYGLSERIDLCSFTGIKSGETKQFTLNDANTFKDGVCLCMISDAEDFEFEISVVASSTAEPVKVIEPAAGTLYRLYNPNSSEHFYTGSTTERDSLTAVGWKDEGTAWTSPEEGSPVYRLYNPNAGDHFYTVSAGEKDRLVAAGWRYEGIGWNSDTNNTVPVYREYNPNAKTGSHNYTTSKSEHDHLVSLGWKDEGIAWYGA